MKRVLILLLISSISLVVKAQENDTKPILENRFYAGVGLNGRQFLIDYRSTEPFLQYGGSFRPFPYLHIGYKLNEKIQIEVGTGYSNYKRDGYVTYVEAPGKLIDYHTYSQTIGIVIPVKINYTLFNVFKTRVAIYGTGSVLPAYSTTQIRKKEVKDGVTNTTLNIEDSGFNTFASLGIGARFKIWKRFSGYYEINILNRNLSTGENMYSGNFSRHTPLSRFSKGLGINYNFQLLKRTSAKKAKKH